MIRCPTCGDLSLIPGTCCDPAAGLDDDDLTIVRAID